MKQEQQRPEALWEPSAALKLAGGVTAVMTFLVTLVGLGRDDWHHIREWLFIDGAFVNPRSALLAIIATNTATFFAVYRLLFKERIKRIDQADENDNLRLQLDDIERERLLDLKTGVPNEKKLIGDFAALRSANLSETPAHLILIDIENFRSVNNRHGHQKGTAVIRLIAQSIFHGMRRDEEIYTPRNAKLYRPFVGGDEFIFLIRGKQYEAVGFITRLHQNLERLSDEAEEILGAEFKIDFHGAIAPIYQNDDYEDAVSRLEQCFVEAKKETHGRRVYWWKQEEGAFPEDDFRRDIYARAISRFGTGTTAANDEEVDAEA